MVGDVFELPHLTDFHPLNETIPVGLRRFYQITDANYASEGFSSTWYPHLWRIKCEPLVNSQEFNDILKDPINKDNYLGDWDPNKEYIIPEGQTYTITYGEKIYEVTGGPGGTTIPAGVMPPAQPWTISKEQNLIDIISSYNTNIAINQAVIDEAKRVVPKIGYDRSQLYVVPTYEDGQPAPPINLIVNDGAPIMGGQVVVVQSAGFSVASRAIRISGSGIAAARTMSLQLNELAAVRLDTGSGQVSGDLVLTVSDLGTFIAGPYGTADNTYATADQFVRSIATFNPTPIFSTVISLVDPITNSIAKDLLVRATVYSQNGLPQAVFPPNTRITDFDLRNNTITVSAPTQSEVPGSTRLEIGYDFKGIDGTQTVARNVTVTSVGANIAGATAITIIDTITSDLATKIIGKLITAPSEYFAVGTRILSVDYGKNQIIISEALKATMPADTAIAVEFRRVTTFMDYRADVDPRFQYIRRYSPRNFGYLTGYDSGNGEAPNGEPLGAGITFPANPQIGDYFLRIDYLPQKLFRWSGTLWVEISQNVRTEFGFDEGSKNQLSTFINDTERTPTSTGQTIPTRQSLSNALRIQPD